MADEPQGTASIPESDSTSRYQRQVGFLLALLAFLAGWIAVLETNAATNEARTTREATRLAADAEGARVLAKGVSSAINQVTTEVATFEERPAFGLDGVDAGQSIDPLEREVLVTEGKASIEASIADPAGITTRVDTRAKTLTLEQSAVVAERVTWNARASQYQTVLTMLAVAVFLVGFSLVVQRGLRPLFAAPGLLLVAVCFGWALQIHHKPIPAVDQPTIASTADGQVALDQGRAGDAVEAFTRAVELDDKYAPAFTGLATAKLLEANPDILTTFALTDVSPPVLSEATTAIDRSIALVGDDRSSHALAGIIAIAGTDWDEAAMQLDVARDGNDLAPGLQLSRAAVAIAQGDETTANEMIALVQRHSGDLAQSNAARSITANYLTLLEWVATQEPERAASVDRFRVEAVQLLADAQGGLSPLAAGDTPTVTVRTAEFVEDRTTVDLDVSGVDAATRIAIVGYERPAPGAAWVQSPELFFVGPPGDHRGVTLATPRGCAPVEYRFDLYAGGQRVDSVTAPGTDATC